MTNGMDKATFWMSPFFVLLKARTEQSKIGKISKRKKFKKSLLLFAIYLN
jgi:hypothetical protein